ncbi:hypothetical protein LU293_08950 [Moraxella nasovis]|uniref:hypothetical protein n=1 Tax=Moraxella nasovis TaxID=2904121 RepID=UPI001F617054|nr:hypothetical protein [Moraxella nasovis]UNU73188.1 hypothetical protein LU293_08950 [Moraxella nasovis]
MLDNIGDDLPEFLVTLISTFSEMMHEYSEQVQSVKKAIEHCKWQKTKSELSPKRIEIYQRLNLPLPDEVVANPLLDDVMRVFVLVSRARRYHHDVALPLLVKDISDVLTVNPIAMARWLIDDVVFELDEFVRG